MTFQLNEHLICNDIQSQLGLVSPVLLPANKIFENLSKDKSLGLDDEVSAEHKQG